MTTVTTLELPKFFGHAYGVNLDWIGEDGEMVAHGHVEPRRFVAAANRWSRESAGFGLLGDSSSWMRSTWTYAEFLQSVSHRWAVRLAKCACPADKVAYEGCDEHDLEPEPDEWWLRCDGVTADTPGAFPVTLGQWM